MLGDWDMDDRDTNHNGEKNSASDLLEIAAQLAALAEDIKTLAAMPIEQISTSIEPGDRPEASSQ
ncbi:hypothetical protein CDO28_21315 (plasmid) [Sinorhizobium meliloti]|nr:hypothetical protein CDO28_21315 [Sinorhizobium meliloti]MDW9643238.1 hypothetical protein [Sinorhizobium meliloti]MQV22616.1 hypothetical protein [Sinorhizobium meliloti]MQW51924.1 hypothetical protein [Sinorhizobium meliloti]RVI68964.1 hypothetical protein CN189_03805 [Sinorhizobium meliloti]